MLKIKTKKYDNLFTKVLTFICEVFIVVTEGSYYELPCDSNHETGGI